MIQDAPAAARSHTPGKSENLEAEANGKSAKSELEAVYKDLVGRRPALLDEKLKLHAKIIDEFNLAILEKLPRGGFAQRDLCLCRRLR